MTLRPASRTRRRPATVDDVSRRELIAMSGAAGLDLLDQTYQTLA